MHDLAPQRRAWPLSQRRQRIEAEDCPQDYDIVAELRAEGVSDYLIQPLPFTSGEARAISWTTTRPGGFTDADLAALDAVRRPLARLIEIYALRRTAANLLDTYVGSDAGEAILICEKHVQPIHLMLTDIVMPQMNGGDLAHRLESIHPEMKVIFMSGHTDQDILKQVLVLKKPLLLKPFRPDALARKVREALAAA